MDVHAERLALAELLRARLNDPTLAARDFAACANALSRCLSEIERSDPGSANPDAAEFLASLERLANAPR